MNERRLRCSIEGCDGAGELDGKRGVRYFRKGYCSRHYQRLKRHGDPLVTKLKFDGRDSHPLAHTYKGMKARCYTLSSINYHRYGGRGITVCDRWLGDRGFWNFVEDMGSRPKGYSIERIDNNAGYSPENCKWAGPKEQALNTRNVLGAIRFEYNGESRTIKEWSNISGVKPTTLHMRLTKYKWPIAKALGQIGG